VGRFISADPLGFGAGDTNIYRYVGNSFVNEIDPSGLISCVPGDEESSWWNRALGGLQVIGGVLQVVTGVGIAGGGTAGTGGLGAAPAVIGGGLIVARGADDVQAGLRQIWTGQHTNTVTHDTVKNLTGNEGLATGVDILTGLAGPAAEIKAAREAAALARVKQAEALLAAEKAAVQQAATEAAAMRKVCCFVAGTLIQTRDGEKAIQDIQIGDWVLSDDPNTPGGIEYKQVLQTFNHETNYLVDVYIGGEKITTTENHPFWVKDVGWVAARDLGAGAQLETKGESWLGVDKVERHTEVATVYNFEVQGFHTYFVSDLGLLVHNGCDFTRKSLQHGLDGGHGPDFGVVPATAKNGSPKINNPTIKEFSEAIDDFIDNAPMAIQGTYRGQPATHYYDYNTRLWVAVNSSNNQFVAGFKLGADQAINLLTTGTFW
jgi:Pretoxin HINT domain/Colicin D